MFSGFIIAPLITSLHAAQVVKSRGESEAAARVEVSKSAQLASWYGDERKGKAMANGKPFDPDALTAASWHYPLGTRVRVTHGDSSVVVTITDRGPHRRYSERVIDLSRAAFERLADLDKGLVTVHIEKL